MSGKSLTVDQILSLLREGPPRIAAHTAGLSMAQLHDAPGPDEWSLNEVLAHLRSCADVWGGCITTIIAEDRPAIRAVNPRTWIKDTDYLEQQFKPSLEAFTAQRADLLAVLEGLAADAWDRSATVSVAGKPLERTVLFYAEWLATHERSHVKSIGRVVKAMQAWRRP